MRVFVTTVLLILQVGSAYASYCQQDVFFNCKDAIKFSNQADALLSEIGAVIERQMEVAEKASWGAIGSTERKLLNERYQVLKEHIEAIEKDARFKDQFQNTWAFLREGLRFWTPLPIAGTSYKYQRQFEFSPLFNELPEADRGVMSFDDYFDSSVLTQEGASEAVAVMHTASHRLNEARIEAQEPKHLCQWR